jgi:hypothetical protein
MRAEAKALLIESNSVVMKWSLRSLVTAFIASALVVSTTYAQSTPETNPLETRAKEFARAVSTGRPEDLTQLVRDSFGGNLQNIPMPAHIGALMSYWDQSRGLTFQQLVNPTEVQALAIFENHLTGGPTGIFLAVEREAPHRIVSIWPLNQLRKPMPEEARPTMSARQLSD